MNTQGTEVNLGIEQCSGSQITTSTTSLAGVDELNRSYASIDYRLESARLASYENWSVPVAPAKLAAAGLFFTGKSDRVKCFECGVQIFEWVEGDNPVSEHQRWRSNCRFIRKLPCGNVPIGVDPDTVPISEGRDVCGLYGEDYRCATPDFRFDLSLVERESATHSEDEDHASKLVTSQDQPELTQIEKELIGDGRLCKICFNAELGIVFLPCRHMIACTKCALNLEACGVCRANIRSTIQAILS